MSAADHVYICLFKKGVSLESRRKMMSTAEHPGLILSVLKDIQQGVQMVSKTPTFFVYL